MGYDNLRLEKGMYREAGRSFAQVLEHAGVYGRGPEGKAAFLRFIQQV